MRTAAVASHALVAFRITEAPEPAGRREKDVLNHVVQIRHARIQPQHDGGHIARIAPVDLLERERLFAGWGRRHNVQDGRPLCGSGIQAPSVYDRSKPAQEKESTTPTGADVDY